MSTSPGHVGQPRADVPTDPQTCEGEGVRTDRRGQMEREQGPDVPGIVENLRELSGELIIIKSQNKY